MATPSKKASGWGSFLQQAVAGVESRLDNILADGPDEAAKPSKPTTPATGVAAIAKADGGPQTSC